MSNDGKFKIDIDTVFVGFWVQIHHQIIDYPFQIFFAVMGREAVNVMIHLLEFSEPIDPSFLVNHLLDVDATLIEVVPRCLQFIL